MDDCNRHENELSELKKDMRSVLGILNNGLKDVVVDQKTQLALMRVDVSEMRQALVEHVSKEDIIYRVFNRSLSLGLAIIGTLLSSLLGAIGWLLTRTMPPAP